MPAYPIEARRQSQQGEVKLRVLVSAFGKAQWVRVVESSGHELLDNEAVKAVKQWEFEPKVIERARIELTIDVPISFKIAR